VNSQLKFRFFLGTLAVTGLLIVFLFQSMDVGDFFGIKNKIWSFMANRSIRFVLNDGLTILLIYALFAERKYVVFALWVQVVGLVGILIPYFIIKFNFPSYNGPLISFLHRIILNPMLMMLLIPAFYFQKRIRR
jgi:exosortase F-associated protein